MDAAPSAARTESTAAPLPEPLSALEARVLGCLIEKELSTPEYYPLSLNALVNACNQKNNRDPVMLLSAREVEVTLDGMRQRRLAGLFAGADARVPKFRHTLDLVLPMEVPDRAVLAELLLRGPQTPGELRGRCERMVAFGSVEQVDEVLARLAARPAGAVVCHLPRQPGQKEARWAQVLTGEPATPAG
ncbi:MAG: YceH family protein, partial [Opitutaceae bacterium]|nr:YceH family protein [Opitutaceae bacterium]